MIGQRGAAQLATVEGDQLRMTDGAATACEPVETAGRVSPPAPARVCTNRFFPPATARVYHSCYLLRHGVAGRCLPLVLLPRNSTLP